MTAAITEIDLENAAQDAATLATLVNGAATPSPIVTRLGRNALPLAAIELLGVNAAAAATAQAAIATAAAVALNALENRLAAIKAVQTVALPANTYANGTAGVGATVTGNANGALTGTYFDGVTPTVGMRLGVLLEGAHNGYYILTAVGDGSHPFILTRLTDADTANELGFASALVISGTLYAGYRFVVSQAAGAITVGTTALTIVADQNSTGVASEAVTRAAQVGAVSAKVLDLQLDNFAGVAGAIVDPAGRLAFGIDMTGKMVGGAATDLITRAGKSSFVLPGAGASPVATVNMFAISGQSLAVGFNAGGVLTTSQPFSNTMFNGGLYHPSSQTSFVPMVEQVVGSQGETMANGLADDVASKVAGAYPMLCVNWGLSSQPISSFVKGQALYADLMDGTTGSVKLAHDIAAANYDTFYLQAYCFVQGESDEASGTTRSAYSTALAGMFANINTDGKAITGQSHNVKMFFDQTCSWTFYSRTTPTIALAQLDVHNANATDYILVGPKYQYTYTDAVHLTAYEYRHQGAYFAKVYRKVVVEGEAWLPLKPLSAVKQNARSVILKFHVPYGPLVFDTVNVTDPGSYGFQVIDAGGLKTITSVELLGNDSVRILVSTDISGSYEVDYACKGNSGDYAGWNCGPRGCLRDSDPEVSYYLGSNGLPYPLQNWCVVFKQVGT